MIARVWAPAKGRFAAWWSGRDDEAKHFWTNVAIGVALTLALQVSEVFGAFAALRQFGLDWQIAALAGTHTGPHVALIDIDEPSELSFADKGMPPPFFTPRDKLGRLIEAAVDAGAAAVVVDVDLSEPRGDPLAEAFRETSGRPAQGEPAAAMERRLTSLAGRPKSPAAPAFPPPPPSLDAVQRFFYGDWQLSEFLGAYSRGCAGKPWPPAPGSCVPVILPRLIGESTAVSKIALPSFLDRAIGPNSRSVFWGSVTFDHDPDFVVRRWRLWEPACAPSRGSDVLPGSALLAYAFGKPLAPGEAWNYQSQLAGPLQAAFAPAQCRSVAPPAPRSVPNVRDIELKQDDLARTLRYFISWNATDETSSLERDFPAVEVLGGAKLDLNCSDPDGCVRGKRVVVIGSTFRDNGDYHRVPGGEMPGVLVLLNEIDSLLSTNPVLGEAPRLLSVGLDLVLVIALSWAFMRWHPTAVLVGALIVTLAGLIASSLASLESGVWFDLSVPCIGIQIHEWVTRAEHFRLLKRKI